jgi:hypothetical protein
MEAADDDSGSFLVVVKAMFLWLLSHVANNYHEMAGNLLVTLSIIYLLWKWWRDYKKSKV